MKKGNNCSCTKLLIISILLLFAGMNYSQTWRRVIDEPFLSGQCVFFLNSTTGWYCSSYKTLFKTTDGGLTWIEKFRGSESTPNLKSVVFVNDNVGYAGGEDALFVKTTDGGETWQTSEVGSTANDIIAIHFSDENTGWVAATATDSAAIFKTTDGGASWTRVLTHKGLDIEDMDFYGTHGVAVGGGVGSIVLYYTADGDNWIKAPVPSLGEISYSRSDLRGVFMVNENVIYAGGYGSNVGAQPTLLVKSTDGGATWQYLLQPLEQRTYTEVKDFYFKDELNGIACGGTAIVGTTILKTSDGGINWLPQEIFAGFSAYDLYVIGDEVWVIGAGGNIIHSTDFGTSWAFLNKISGCTLYSIESPEAGIIYAGGTDGVFFRSTDLGKNWNRYFVTSKKACPSVSDIFFLDKNVGFAGQSYNLFSKTTDGGESWIPIIDATMANMTQHNGIYFFDENTGIIAGVAGSTNDIVYKTIDGCQTWTSQSNQIGKDINSLTFCNATNGVIGADDSKILYTTDTGTSWQSSVITDATTALDINEIAFADELKGFAVGEKIMLQTSDGGLTWSSVPGFSTDKTLESIKFFNADTGYAVGARLIYKTTDGGVTWNDVCDTNLVKNSLYSVTVDKNGYAWISGGSSIIITNAPETPDVSVAEGSSPYTFELTQNYPNPFNPSTTISYSLDKRSSVTINVYDILGRLAGTLFSGEKEAGKHSINFSAANLASGVYICTINANGKVKSIKMDLLK